VGKSGGSSEENTGAASKFSSRTTMAGLEVISTKPVNEPVTFEADRGGDADYYAAWPVVQSFL